MIISLLFLAPFLIYVPLCLLSILLRYPFFLEKQTGRINLFIIKDNIHSDLVFESKYWKGLFNTNKKYVIIGWGDRKIFLETSSWGKLKLINVIKAFFGLNSSIVRVEYVNELPKNKKINKYKINKNQLSVLKDHVLDSLKNLKKIKKLKTYYQKGDFYSSDLRYSCIYTCNNWVNIALRKIGMSNKIWCPISFWL
jgi:uncharacterized protein (TIGR02117 family)